MTNDLPQSVVIVDRSRRWGISLRASLNQCQVSTHVFHTYAAALALLRSKKIDAVVVEFDGEVATTKFCDEAKSLHVPVVFAPTPISDQDLRHYGFQATFQDVPGRPGMFVHYDTPKP